MAYVVMGRVGARKIGSASRRCMMMALADRAHADGTGIYASVQTLADLAEVSRETAKRLLKDFLDEELIVFVRTRKIKNGFVNEYRIDLEKIDALPAIQPDADAATFHAKGGHPDPGHGDPGSPRPVTGVTMTPKPVQEPETPLPTVEESGAPVPGASPPPDGDDIVALYEKVAKFQNASAGKPAPPITPAPSKPTPARRRLDPALELTEKGRAFARERGFDSAQAESLFQAFRDHHLAKGSVMADWAAAWRTWVNNEVKFHGQRGRSGVRGSQSGGARPADGRYGGHSAVSVLSELTRRVRERENELPKHG